MSEAFDLTKEFASYVFTEEKMDLSQPFGYLVCSVAGLRELAERGHELAHD